MTDCATCRLVLSSGDRWRASRLAAIAGMATGGHVSLTADVQQNAARDDKEPMTSIACTCGAQYQLATFLVEFSARHSFELPRCKGCR